MHTQAPSGAGWNRTQALLILRAGNVLPTSRGNLRKMGSRGGEYEREALILSRALAPLWFLSGRPERNPPRRAELPCRPQAAKSPLQETKPLCHRPLIRHGFAVPPFPIPSVASRHLPLIRGVGPREEGFFGGPHPAPLGPPLPQGEGLGGRPHGAAPAAETDLLERNGGNTPSPLFPLFNFQLLC